MTIAAAGIDAGRKTPDIRLNGRDHAATNGADGFRKVAGVPRDGGAERVVMEAAGRMRRALRQSPRDRGFAVLAGSPRQSRDFAKAAGDMAKTDRAGARVPAAFGAAFPARPPTAPAEAATGRLRDMPALRERLVDRRVQPRAVFDGAGDPDPDGPVPKVLPEIEAGVRRHDRRIAETVAGAEELAGSRGIPMPVPGIGPAAAAALTAWMGELGAIGSRQAAAPVGVAPFARDSGTLKGARRVAGGRRRPRDVPCMAAMAACQFNPEMAELRARLAARGKRRKVAVTAVMRRTVAAANALLRDRRMWEDRTAAAAG